MKIIIALTLLLVSVFFINNSFGDDDNSNSKSAQTAEQTVKFSIENMTCKMCDITVRKSMEKVNGVVIATVDYGSKTVTVVFDPSKTDVKTIGMASANAGYKATSI